MEKKIYYMAVARDTVTLADTAKSHKAKYQQSTNDIIGKLGRGDVILPFNEMEYAVKNESGAGGLTYLMLVEKGYYQVKAFQCLEKVKEEFARFFDKSQIANARYLSLSKEFEREFERIYEEFSKNTLDKMGAAIEATNNLNKNVTATLDNLIARDEKLDEMMLKTEEMSDLSYSISSKVASPDQSRKVHRNAFWGSITAKIMYVCIAVVRSPHQVVLYFLLVLFCGDLTLSKCFG